MANTQRKKKKSIRFELSLIGLFGLGVVAFSVLLWMFLLGIWAGQTILLPEGGGTVSLTKISGLLPKSGAVRAPVATPAQPATPTEDPQALAAEPDYGESSFFSLQVAAFSAPERAEKEATAWRQRGVEAFSLRPEEGGDGLYRVCVGRFAELAEANREASRLEEAENIKPFITLVPAPKARQP